MNLFILCILLAAIKLDASPYHPSMMKGEFKSCLQGVCHLVSDIFFIVNECFTNNQELGIYYYLKNIVHVAQLNGDYEIIDTNCTMSAEDERKTDDIGLYNFINDRYDIVYLILLASAKIIIGVLCFLICKKRTRSVTRMGQLKSQSNSRPLKPMESDKNLQPIREAYSLTPTAPPLPQDVYVFDAPERTIAETRGSMLASTRMSYNSGIFPSFANSYESQTKSTSCSCHATELVCTNCSCVRNNRACNAECHISKAANKSKRPIAFKCINKYN